MKRPGCVVSIALWSFASISHAALPPGACVAPSFYTYKMPEWGTRCNWYPNQNIEGITRSAIVCNPAAGSPSPAPVVLVFHGHNDCGLDMGINTQIHEAWPQAKVIYMSGLAGWANTEDTSGVRTGWQWIANSSPVSGYNNTPTNDLTFVDTVINNETLAGARSFYAVGHSNGSMFLGLLWNKRGSKFKAFAFNAGQANTGYDGYKDVTTCNPCSTDQINLLNSLKKVMQNDGNVAPSDLITGSIQVPVAMSMGCTDTSVPYQYQFPSIHAAEARLGISPGLTQSMDSYCPPTAANGTGASFDSISGANPLPYYIHPNGHVWPQGSAINQPMTDANGVKWSYGFSSMATYFFCYIEHGQNASSCTGFTQ